MTQASDDPVARGPALVAGPVRVRTPATSANLGPGFDSLGLALTRYDEVTASAVDRPGCRVRVTGEGAGELPGDGSHLVVRAMRAVFDRAGVQPVGLELSCRNGIPQARGMGSSSAAIVAGLLLARALLGDRGAGHGIDDANLLDLATALEGHPDNVAPCLLGGLTIAWRGAGGVRAARLAPSPAVRPVLLVPPTRGLTAGARAALPGLVPHADAAFNAGRAALLVHALTTAPHLLMAATEDRLHQGYRAAGMPATALVVARLREIGIPAVVSGAGPSVLALVLSGQHVPEQPGFAVIPVGFDLIGAQIG